MLNNFTKDFFSNTSTSSKKKVMFNTIDDEEDNKVNFTDSFFNSVNYSKETLQEYNDFIDRLNETKKANYKEKVDKTEAGVLYYSKNKEKLKENRNNNLIYDWDVNNSGRMYYDYGSVPEQDKHGYLKQTDDKGNVYWQDIKNDKVYDSNYNDITNNTELTNTLKYKYSDDGGDVNKLDSRYLSTQDRLSLNKIDETKYMSIVDEAQSIPDQTRNPNADQYGLKLYTGTTPKKQNENSLAADVYKSNFEKLNKALEDGDLTTANNALEVINQKYFGHSMSDGVIDSISNDTFNNMGWFYERFNTNVEKLNVINDSIANTSDAEVLNELYKQKDRLELENTLIQYNRILETQSLNKKLDKLNGIWNESDEAWDKVGKLWSDTFSNFEDGYDLGDSFKTIKKFWNNTIQSLAAAAVTVNSEFSFVENLLVSDLDDSTFKEKWLPAIMDVGTYVIPYVGQARFIINLVEPGAVVNSFVTGEGSSTIDSEDGEPRVATPINALGAVTNIAANMFSNAIFKNIRVRLGEKGVKQVYDNTARGIATLIFKDAAGEGAEEFIQTFAEILQNTENIDDINWLKALAEAGDAALIAFVTSGLASGTSIAIDSMRTGDIRSTMLSKAELSNVSQDGEIENVRLNKDLSDVNKVTYASSDIKEYETINKESQDLSTVNVDTDEKVATSIATELENNNVITILNSDSVVKNTDINLDDVDGSVDLSNIVVNDNIKTVIVGSKELETYIKSLKPDVTTVVFDPKSPTFMDDVKTYVSDVAKSNIVPKNVSDFTVNNYKLSPTEVNDINAMVDDSLKHGHFQDGIINKDIINLEAITPSDITDSDINTIMNSIRNKFLAELDNNKITKETAQKEFKSLNEKLSNYVLKTKENRTYVKDSNNNIIVFSKKAGNIYEAVDSMPRVEADLSLLANVKTNGNIINGNLSTKIDFAKKQLNAVNNLIDKLKLKGNYLTNDSTYKDIASLLKQNREFSKEILQSLNADGLIEGKNKVRLYTAFDNLDNANITKMLTNTANYLKSDTFNNELNKKAETTAPKVVELKPEESKVSTTEKPISVEEYAQNPDNPSELNNIELEQLLDDTFKDLEIKDKISKNIATEIKDYINNAIFDSQSHIVKIANANEDYNVKQAIYNLQAVASDAQTMINGAQLKDGDVIGKSLKQIYSENNLKNKKDKELFEKVMLHALNAERENAGVDKIFENVSAKQSEAIVRKAFEQHSNFEEAARDLQRYNNNLLNMLVDGGVISEELSNKLKSRYKYYMPIYSSDLSTFADLDSSKYLKSLSLDNSIKDVTKTGKQILSLEKSMENKTYNVLSAIAKNKLAQAMSSNTNYEGTSDLLFYKNGELTKTKVTPEILSDINNNKASHIADVIHELPGLKQLIDLSNMSYKFILDPIYQIKNVTIDLVDSAMIYSKDKQHFIPNYFKAIQAVANNSELFHECLELGLGKIGDGWNAPKVEYDANGNIATRQNKFQRVYANLEAMPKIAEYISLKEKYTQQIEKDYNAGKYNNSSKYAYTNEDGEVVTFYRYHKDAKNITDNYNYNYSNVSHKTGFGIAFMDNDTYTKGKANKDIIKTTLSSENGFLTNTDAKLTNEQITNLNSIFNKYIPDITMFTDNITEADTINMINQASEFIANATDNNTGKKAWDEFYDSLNKDGYVLTNKDGSRTAVVKSTKQIDSLNNNSTPTLKSLIDTAKDKAMLDASDVNLNFNRGGKVTKALSKSGFKFLNAGIQGFDKFVTHVGEGVKTPKGMGSLLLEFTAVGATTAIANAILNGDDEDYDKLPYYYKNNYYMIKIADGQYFRIPKGRVQTLYNVLFEYATGLREEDIPQDYIDSLKSAFELAVAPPALEEASPIAAYSQIFNNKDAFGNEIYSDKYDTTEQKVRKSIYHLLSNYFGRYGRMVKDITDDDSTTDVFNEFDMYKDTTKANRHYNTALQLVEYYQNSNNVKTLDDKAMKKYIDTQNYALRSINSEINQGKKAGLKVSDLKEKYATRDDLLKSMINNYKNFDTKVDENGNTWYYFDEHCFMYNAKTKKFVKKY